MCAAVVRALWGTCVLGPRRRRLRIWRRSSVAARRSARLGQEEEGREGGRTVSDDAALDEDEGEDEVEDADARDLVAAAPGEDRARRAPILAVFVIIQGGEVLMGRFSARGLEPAELTVGRVREGDEGRVEEGAQDVCLGATAPARSALFAFLGVAVGGLGVLGVLGEGGAGLELDHLDAEGGAEDLLGAGKDDVELARAGAEDCVERGKMEIVKEEVYDRPFLEMSSLLRATLLLSAKRARRARSAALRSSSF